MNILIGSIKHCNRDRIDNWVKSAIKNSKCEIVLLVLDTIIPESIKELEFNGVKIIHTPTKDSSDVNICKWERHIKVREYLKSLDENDVVLLTDTLDVVFQKDPFEWFKQNAKKDIVLTSEGILHVDEPWNMRSILEDHNEFVDEIKQQEVINSGVMIGKVKPISSILLHTYMSTKGLNPSSADQPALNVILLSSFIKDQIQIINSDDNFVIHCAVAGPTSLFHSWGFSKNYKYGLPILKNDEIINEKTNEPFCLVHQYNRVEEWNQFFINKYQNVILPKKKMGTKTAIVNCSRVESGYHQDWLNSFKFDNDDYILCDVTNSNPLPINISVKYVQDNVVTYNIDNIRTTLNFDKDPSDQHWWNIGGGRNIIWFYPHFRMMYFYKLFPDYDYYWFFDDDVTFPNNQLYDFVKEHKSLDHDCMISYIFGNINQKQQEDTHDMDERMVAYHAPNANWLSHYPGPGDNQPGDVVETYGSYFPLVRLSNEALRVLIEEHEKGFYGYSEGYVPTILNHRGLKLYSIYDKDSNVKINKDIIVYHRRYHQMKWENL